MEVMSGHRRDCSCRGTCPSDPEARSLSRSPVNREDRRWLTSGCDFESYSDDSGLTE